ncbi:MAG TPA: zf-HC2 domain-containing protein [Anaerolineaceae bacterium]|nr:zf-HC2 domain-containing protein [Anaerolineaceae bacterium]
MNTISTLPCDVITDLMVAYESGEASPATQRLVDEHLAGCPTCRAAFGSDRLAADRLPAAPPPPLTNGRAFVARTRRLAYAAFTAVLLLLALIGGMAMRLVIQELANQALPASPRVDSLFFLFTPAALVLYLLALIPSAQSGSRPSGVHNGLLPTVRLFLLAGLTFGVYELFALSTATAASLGALMLVIALAVTFLRLPHLAYATAVTVTVLLLLNLVFVGRTVYTVAQGADFRLQPASSLGQPPAGATAEDAVTFDLTDMGLSLESVNTGTQLLLPTSTEPMQGAWAIYHGDAQQVTITVVQFADANEAHNFFQSWEKATNSGVRVLSVENNSFRSGGGSTLRFYSPADETAYSSWQYGTWFTLVEATGPLGDAMRLVRDVKEIVSDSYQTADN